MRAILNYVTFPNPGGSVDGPCAGFPTVGVGEGGGGGNTDKQKVFNPN